MAIAYNKRPAELFLVHMFLFRNNEMPKDIAGVKTLKKVMRRAAVTAYSMQTHPYAFYAVVSTTSRDEAMAWLKMTPGVHRSVRLLKNANPYLLRELAL